MRDRIQFNPEKRPRIPVGARQPRYGARTFFHILTSLWDAAKKEHDGDKNFSGAIKRFEDYATAVNNHYHMMTESFRVAEEEVKKSGLDSTSVEGEILYERVRREYIEKNKVPIPEV